MDFQRQSSSQRRRPIHRIIWSASTNCESSLNGGSYGTGRFDDQNVDDTILLLHVKCHGVSVGDGVKKMRPKEHKEVMEKSRDNCSKQQ